MPSLVCPPPASTSWPGVVVRTRKPSRMSEHHHHHHRRPPSGGSARPATPSPSSSTTIVDPALRAHDYSIPNLNSSFVEYEVFLKRLLERGGTSNLSSTSTQHPGHESTSPPSAGGQHGHSRASSMGPSMGLHHPQQQQQQQYRSTLPARRTASTGPPVPGPASLRARQENDAAAAAWDASIETMLNAAAIGNWEGSAVAGDDHVSELLRLYLNGDLLENMTSMGSRDLFDSMMSLRRDHIFPMITASKAAYGALIAYMETTPGMPTQSENEYFVPWHLNLAFSLVNAELADPEKMDSDSVILTVVLLMMISVSLFCCGRQGSAAFH